MKIDLEDRIRQLIVDDITDDLGHRPFFTYWRDFWRDRKVQKLVRKCIYESRSVLTGSTHRR